MSNLYRLSQNDFLRGLASAVVGGAFFPVIALVQSSGFNVADLDYTILVNLIMNGAVTGFVSYLTTKFFTNKDGAIVVPVLGAITAGDKEV